MDVALNWLWQGGVLAVATGGLLRVIPRSRARARYRILLVAVAALLALPFVPLFGSPASAPVHTLTNLNRPVLAMPAAWWNSATIVLTLWGLWVLWSGLQAAVAVVALRRARAQAIACPASLDMRLSNWRRLRAGGRRTRLVLSPHVRTAGVLGGGAPVIAIAPALLDRLDDADLDRVVIHEWAHVQRRDDLAQAALLVVRIVAGWHPALWWFERQLHLEREVACDAVAVAATGSAKAYATCLTTLATLPAPGRTRLPALAAVSSSGLRHRVIRIIADPARPISRASHAVALAAVLIILSVTVVVGRLQVVATAFASTAATLTALADRTIPAPQVPERPDAPDAARPFGGDAAPQRRPVRTAPARDAAQEAAAASAMEPPTVPLSATPLLTQEATTLPAAIVSDMALPPPTSSPTPDAAPPRSSAWGVAVDTGKAVASGSQNAALATAGFFTRFGQRVGRSF